MGEWEDITIAHHDKKRSQPLTTDDSELSKQVFVLSDIPPRRWAEICNAALVAEPGRLGRVAEVKGQDLFIWGGPKIFDKQDAKHFQKLLAYVNVKYRETLEPIDLSGLEVFA